MKITKLIIKKLYKHYDYEIVFNEDITIIYGLNGSGKTTVLNILNHLISGELYNIFDYTFDKIELYYMDEMKQVKTITISNDNNNINRKITLNDNEENYELIRQIKPMTGICQEFTSKSFRDAYPFLKDIRRRFKRIYLPLNRGFEYKSQNLRRRVLAHNLEENIHYEYSIKNIADIIKNKYSEIESKIACLNDTFRNNTLKLFSLQFVENNFTDIYSIVPKRGEIVKRIGNIHNNYINILKEFDLINENEKKLYEEYFNDILLEINIANKYISTRQINQYFNLYLKIEMIYRLESIVELADKMEDEKRKIKKDLDLFIFTINEFFRRGSDDRKTLIIEGNRQVYVKNKYGDRILLENLSSGEKQILILFTYLIFELGTEEAIFIVDEPEISLHLLWQRLYLDKIREVAPNVQIIFATHSPEIVSHYKNKMFKLSKDKVDEKIDE